jgi:predicted extracellular nuclease
MPLLKPLRAALAVAGMFSLNAAATPVFINEIHYDNSGTDAGEALEIVGPAGTDLAGWSVVLYNGSGGALYTTTPLSGAIADQFGGFGALALAYPENGIQNGAPDGVALVDNTNAVVQFLSYEGSFVAIDGPAAGLTSTDIGASESSSTVAGQSLQLTGGGTQYEDFVWAAAATSTFGALNNGQTFGAPVDTLGQCFEPATRIHAIQGNGDASPLAGSTGAIVEGVVSGAFQDPIAGMSGFFMQEEGADQDGDAATSEGIFVYTGSNPSADILAIASGDVVRVQGSVSEFNSSGIALTELSGITGMRHCAAGEPPAPVDLALPVSSLDDLERVEGMLVTLAALAIGAPLTVTEVYNLGSFGEAALATGRLYTPTQIVAPGADAIAQQEINDRGRLILDDGSDLDRDTLFPASYPTGGLSATNTLRVGDTLAAPVTGVLDQRYGAYRLHPLDVAGVSFDHANPRPATPSAVGGTLRVASANLLNYFTTLDSGASVCGPAFDQDCRGADSAEEFARQRDKLIAALVAMDAHVVGLVEVENNASAALADLVAGLNAATGAGKYAYVDTGTIGADAIKVGFVYQPGAVAPLGVHKVLDSSVDARVQDSYNRPALAQTFAHNATGQRFTAAVNHFKSKGSDCDDIGDPDTGDGQGNCNLTRVSMAQALIDWLATDPTASGDADFLVLGDLNAYAKEDPLATLESAGYANLAAAHDGETAYSYVFFGQSGTLDYALANTALAKQVTGTTEWHINADEPVALDYNIEWTSSIAKTPAQQAGYYGPGAFRASDHDPLLVGLNLLCGDLDDDNDVDGADRKVWRASLGQCTGAVGFNPRADMDGDSCVGYADYRVWYGCFRAANPR